MDDPLSIKVTYTPALIRQALNCFMLRRLGLPVLVMTPLAVLGLLALYSSGSWSTWLSAVSIALCIAICTIAYIYFLRLKAGEGFFAKSPDPSVIFVFSETGVTTSSALGTSELLWSAFDELLEFPKVWLLIYAKSAYITLPNDSLTDPCKELIRSKLKTSS
jgi:hypothetical protein